MWEKATDGFCKKAFRRGIGVLTSVAILAGSTASLAGEPVNNNFPGATSVNDLAGDMQVLVTSGISGADTTPTPMISSGTDVDYYLIVCSGNRKVSRVTMGNLSADIDLYVYSTTTTHAQLGQSVLGGSQSEVVNIPATSAAVVAKAVGFAGATSEYIIGWACS